jgi:hypothetical protein
MVRGTLVTAEARQLTSNMRKKCQLAVDVLGSQTSLTDRVMLAGLVSAAVAIDLLHAMEACRT